MTWWGALLIAYAVGVICAWPTTTYGCRRNTVSTPLGRVPVSLDPLTKAHVLVGFVLALAWPLWAGIRLFRNLFGD